MDQAKMILNWLQIFWQAAWNFETLYLQVGHKLGKRLFFKTMPTTDMYQPS